jgi:hypothetical protein
MPSQTTRFGSCVLNVKPILKRQEAQHAHAADAPAGAIKIERFLKFAFPIYQPCSRRGAADGQSGRPPASVSKLVLPVAPERGRRIRIACGAQVPLISGQPECGRRQGGQPTISLQRTRLARRDRRHFRMWTRADRHVAPDRAPLNSTVGPRYAMIVPSL